MTWYRDYNHSLISPPPPGMQKLWTVGKVNDRTDYAALGLEYLDIAPIGFGGAWHLLDTPNVLNTINDLWGESKHEIEILMENKANSTERCNYGLCARVRNADISLPNHIEFTMMPTENDQIVNYHTVIDFSGFFIVELFGFYNLPLIQFDTSVAIEGTIEQLEIPYTGGVHVTAADLDGDGLVEIITGTGLGGKPQVRVFNTNGVPTSTTFMAYDPSFTGGVHVATGDIDGDGKAEIITGAGPGAGPHVRAFESDGTPMPVSFFAYDPSFTGGVHVATGDIDGDGKDEIITGAGPGAGPHVRAFESDGTPMPVSFFAYDPSFTGGVHVATGDIDGDGKDEIITGAGPGAGPHVRAFESDGTPMPVSFFAYEPSFTGGVHVATGDIDSDGKDEIITGAGPGAGPHVRAFESDGTPMPVSFFAYNPSFRGGVHVATGDIDGDGKDEIITGAGPGGGAHVRLFSEDGIPTSSSFLAYEQTLTPQLIFYTPTVVANTSGYPAFIPPLDPLTYLLWTLAKNSAEDTIDQTIEAEANKLFLKDHDGNGLPEFHDSWGHGTHSDKSTCPDGCYTIHYSIERTWLTAPSPRQAHIVVRFNSITIHDDAEPEGAGELVLTFTVNGKTCDGKKMSTVVVTIP